MAKTKRKARFKVGQVVVERNNGTLWKIQYDADADGNCSTANGKNLYWHHESELRPLTKREKGD